MGIRFRCHHCESELHVKDFQGGKKGRCPKCEGKFRVPMQDAAVSLAIETSMPVSNQFGSEQDVKSAAQRLETEHKEGMSEKVESKTAKGAEPVAKLKSNAGRAGDELPKDKQPHLQEQAVPELDSSLVQGDSRITDKDLEKLSQDPEAHWYVRLTNGEQFGPAKGRYFLRLVC